jgi:hypothetical protein
VVFYTAAANEAARIPCTLPGWSPDWIARLHCLSNAALRFSSYEKAVRRLAAAPRISPERAAEIAWTETLQYFRPSHVVLTGAFISEEDLDAYRAAKAAAAPPLLAPKSSLLFSSVTGLTFTAFSATPSNVSFTLAWPSGQAFTSNAVDLFATRALGASNAWTDIIRYDLSGILPVANAFSDTVAKTHLPPLPFSDPAWAVYVVVTNIAPLPPDGTEAVTNIVTVNTGPEQPADAAFLRAADLYDGDGDGLTDAYEQYVSGTDPSLSSTAGDGISDGWKVRHGFDPSRPVADGDADGDGLSNYEEYVLGTDPTSSDTDGDSLSDKTEIQIGTDPSASDSDEDGLSDGDEYLTYMTNPKKKDTDNDGLFDGEEITWGTSPFDSDTDNDALGDFSEVKTLHSNPLSRDTDGDGLDDRREYDSHNTVGLDLCNASDAEDDFDNDGFSNVYEHAWGWSYISKTSAYEVATFKIAYITVGQYPYRRSTRVGDGGGGSRLIALGDHPTLAAKMRIPTSTELNHTNVEKRLYFTPASGIYLNGAPLDSLPNPIILPDEEGDVEYTVTAPPSAVGQTARFWLGDDTGKTNTLDLLATVPKITKVELVVSRNPDSSASTNIVPGVTGVICADFSDARFGLPCVTLKPTVQNEELGDGQLIWITDFLLARASGATNGTWTVNWRRWDSAYAFRHGIPVPLGRTRIDVGIDFNFDGELSDEEVGASCDVCIIKGAVVPDRDRSRSIDAADAATATTDTPVIFWVNDDKDTGDFGDGDSAVPGQASGRNSSDAVVNGRDDLVDFFPVWLDMERILDAIPADAGFTYKLRFSKLNAVWTSLSRGETGKFLTEDIAGCGPQLNQNARQAATTNLTASGILIPEAFISAIRADSAKGVVFLEGNGTGRGDLCLDVCLGSKRCWTASVPVHLATVEDMYKRINLRSDGSQAFSTTAPPYCPVLDNGTNLVFLHGFRVTAQEARGWHAKMFKKLHQSGSNARFWGVTWQGDDGYVSNGGLNYFGNVINAIDAASNLAVRAASIPGVKVLMAHSLGNMVAATAIQRHGLRTDKLLALNAAIAAEAFAAEAHNVSRISMVHSDWRAYKPETWASEFHDLFAGTSDWRRNLTWKNRFPAVTSKLYNFCSSGDEVLEQYTGTGTLLGTTGGIEHYAWHKQEHFKGRGLPHGSSYMGWGFQPYNGLIYTSIEANQMTPSQIRGTPVFYCYPTAILSSIPPSQKVFDLMLAHGVPALSRAAGGGGVATLGDERNIDINVSNYRLSGWPNTNGDIELDGHWLHNDMKIVAYRYTHALFDKLVETGLQD